MTGDATWWVGVDLGQARDYSAIAVLQVHPTVTRVPNAASFYHRVMHNEPDEWLTETTPIRVDVVHIERLPLGTSYPAVIERVAQVQQQIGHPSTLVVDATGVGRPVLDSMHLVGMHPVGITITGGSTVSAPPAGYTVPIIGVPKRDIVSTLVIALQNKRLKIAAGLPFVDALIHELQNFKVSISSSGHDSYSAWRESDHDDLVLSMGVAAWAADYHYSNPDPGEITISLYDDDDGPDLISEY